MTKSFTKLKALMNNTVTVTIDAKEYQVQEGKNLVDAAKENGIYIPTLCHFHEVNPPLGTCRICTVVVDGKTTTSCREPSRRLHWNSTRMTRR